MEFKEIIKKRIDTLKKYKDRQEKGGTPYLCYQMAIDELEMLLVRC